MTFLKQFTITIHSEQSFFVLAGGRPLPFVVIMLKNVVHKMLAYLLKTTYKLLVY